MLIWRMSQDGTLCSKTRRIAWQLLEMTLRWIRPSRIYRSSDSVTERLLLLWLGPRLRNKSLRPIAVRAIIIFADSVSFY